LICKQNYYKEISAEGKGLCKPMECSSRKPFDNGSCSLTEDGEGQDEACFSYTDYKGVVRCVENCPENHYEINKFLDDLDNVRICLNKNY
jgi:hypothetical protein